jgi:hypothetical protein
MEAAMKLIPTRGFPLVPLIVSLFVFLFISTPVFADPPIMPVTPLGGGSSENPYQIASLANLYWIAATDGEVADPDRLARWSAHYKQTQNIDASDTSTWYSGAGWTPIGYRTGAGPYDYTYSFMGSYDGQGYIITGLWINRTSTNDVGLFGHVGTGDATGTLITIQRVGLVDVDVKGARGTGTLIGRVTGNENTDIVKCYASGGSVIGDGATGGLVGSNNSYASDPGYKDKHPTISKCWANIDVSWSKAGAGDKIAGLAGCNEKGVIEDSYARGKVTVDNLGGQTEPTPTNIGGLAGCIYYKGDIERSYSTGLVTVQGTVNNVGGFLGRIGSGDDKGFISKNFWDIQTAGSPFGVGDDPLETTDVTDKTTDQMMDADTYSGWTTFSSIWTIDPNINDGYPYLNDTPLVVELIAFTATPSGKGILLQWETASEIDNAGFHIWRSGSAEGMYTQITDTLIPAEGEATLGAEYAYEDTNVARKVYSRHDKDRNRIYVFQDLAGGRTYYYKLEAIDNAGVSEFFGPVSASIQNPAPAPKGWGKIVQP